MFLNSKSYRWRLPHDRTARSGVPSFQAGHYLRCSNAMRRVPDPATGRAKCAAGGFVRYARFERLILDGLEAVLLDGDKAAPASPAAAAARGLEESLSSLRDGLARKRAALDDAILTAAGKPERMAAVERIEARLEEDKREIARLERALEAARGDAVPRASLAVVRA
ncbi:MAG: hypothetical protein ICV73_30250, partial [Acetobacteraceae bacterium]|nr:hypothetical protein [Acetobacteraceae bacterium]